MSRDPKCKQSAKVRTSLAISIQQHAKVSNMVATKRCAWGTCKNDTRYPQRMVKNPNGDPVTFVHFPGQKRQAEKRKRWIDACRRGDSFVCTKDSYICSVHFVGENGPTNDNPDPISATASEEMVSYYKIVIYALYQTAWLSHLDVRRWSRLVKEFRRYFNINRRSEECI